MGVGVHVIAVQVSTLVNSTHSDQQTNTKIEKNINAGLLTLRVNIGGFRHILRSTMYMHL